MKLLKLISILIAVGASLSAFADEPRSPLTDWNAGVRRESDRRSARERSDRATNRRNISMIDVGGGIERALQAAGVEDIDSGWNVLLSVKAQSSIQRDQGYGAWIVMHVDGRVALDPSGSGSQIPYLDVRMVPLSMNQHDELGILRLEFLETQVHRDVRLGRDFRLSVSIIGGSIEHRSEINENIEFILATSANVLGVRMQNAMTTFPRYVDPAHPGNLGTGGDRPVGEFNLRPETAGAQLLDGQAALTLLFRSIDSAWGARITFGGSVNMGIGRTNGPDPLDGGAPDRYAAARYVRERTPVTRTDLGSFAEVGVRLGHLLELYTRLSITHLRENGQNDPVHTRSITQFMAGASLQF